MGGQTSLDEHASIKEAVFMDIFRNPNEVLKETGDSEMRREEEARIKRELEESSETEDKETDEDEES